MQQSSSEASGIKLERKNKTMTEEFLVSTKVRDKRNGKEGVVVPDIFRVCAKNQILVEWDGSSNTQAENLDNLENLGLMRFKTNPEKCQDCIYYNGRCFRYTAGRFGIIFEGNREKKSEQEKRIPDRIYPYCCFDRQEK